MPWHRPFRASCGFSCCTLLRCRGLFSQGPLGIDWNPVLNGTDAFIMVVLASAWKEISYNFVFFMAGLQAVPHSLIEAAAMDGAGPFRRFWAITFPAAFAHLLFSDGHEHHLRLL
jgi:sn-glycerol 3-phosphate transport system permease protein